MLKFYFYTKKSNQLKNGLFSFEFHFTKLELKKKADTLIISISAFQGILNRKELIQKPLRMRFQQKLPCEVLL